jgi:hypothetical protein
LAKNPISTKYILSQKRANFHRKLKFTKNSKKLSAKKGFWLSVISCQSAVEAFQFAVQARKDGFC